MICNKCGNNDSDEGFNYLDTSIICLKCFNEIPDTPNNSVKTKVIEFGGRKYRSLKALWTKKGLTNYETFKKRIRTKSMTLHQALYMPPNFDNVDKHLMVAYLHQQNKYTHKEIGELLGLKITQVRSILKHINQ